MRRQSIFFLGLLPSLLFFASCNTEDDIPPAENEEEVITTVTLTFTPDGGGTPVAFSYHDPEGPEDATADTIRLSANTTYQMNIKILNETVTPAEDITEEIREEQEAHLFLFGWTGNIFSNPANGNIMDNRDDVNYNDEDENGLPVGLSTTWTTAAEATTGSFRVVLKHQPDSKSATSGIDDGISDIDTDPVFPVVIQ